MVGVHVMCGIAGSGKSHLALFLTNQLDAVYVSSDDLRKQWYGNAAIQGDASAIFTEIRNVIRKALKDGRPVVYDATNLSRRRRIHFIRNDVRGFPVVAHTVCPSISVCLERNRNRERKVKEEVIHQMYKNFEFPFKEEGFAAVHYYPENESQKQNKESFEQLLTLEASYQEIFHAFNQLEGFLDIFELPHDKKGHTFSVSRHTFYTLTEMKKMPPSTETKKLLWASMLHDLGKGATKSFLRFNGEPRKYAGFEGHDNVSTYLTVRILHQFGYSLEFICSVAKLVQFHHFFETESKKKRKQTSFLLMEDDLKNLSFLQYCNDRAK